MRLVLASLLFFLLIVLACDTNSADTTAGNQEPPSKLPHGVVANVNGQEVTLEDYRRFLFFKVGTRFLENYIDKLLVEREAKSLGISIPYETIEKETKKEIQRRLDPHYLEHLKNLGISYEQQVEKIRRDVLERIVLDRCLMKTRTFTEEEVKKKFEETYGKEGNSTARYEEARVEILQLLRDRPPTPEERKEYKRELREKAKIQIDIPSVEGEGRKDQINDNPPALPFPASNNGENGATKATKNTKERTVDSS